MMNLLNSLGESFPLVVAGCLELLAGVALFGYAVSGRKRKKKTGKEAFTSEEKIALSSFGEQKEEAYLIIHVKDRMPVCAGENLEKITGVSFGKLQQDITNLGQIAKNSKEGRKIWESYYAWDGTDRFQSDFQAADDQWLWMTAERSADGRYDLILFRVITQMREMIEKYRNQIEVLEEESNSKTTFLSRMSHEIRTPMNGIIGMVTLAEGKLEKTHPAMQYLDKVDEISDHLLSLINDILDISRIEAGKVELEQKTFSIQKLGDKIYNMFAKSLSERGIHYEVRFEDKSVDYVIGDELRISQVIINFLSNAVKFTEKGEIIVTFRQMMEKDDMVDLMISVHDTGIGMSTEFINRIFRPFEQEGIDISKKYGGTGLGMAITDQIVRLMGGEIVVKSEEGKGSDFSVFLHLPKALQIPETAVSEQKQEAVEKTEHYNIRGCRILLAEDNEINAMIAQEILEQKGAKVEVAENGELAVEAFRTHPAGYYDVILMDVQMPVMDGRKAAGIIRKTDRRDAGRIPIFALSADAFVEDERMSIESGMNGHFAKPIDFTMLEQRLGAFLEEQKQHEKAEE